MVVRLSPDGFRSSPIACLRWLSRIRNAKDSPKRADAFKQMAKTFGVTVKDIFWTQGRYDIVTIVEAPDESAAMSLNLSLGALGNVRTESLQAFSAADMATVVGKMI